MMESSRRIYSSHSWWDCWVFHLPNSCRGDDTHIYFTEAGALQPYLTAYVPERTLEDTVTRADGDEKAEFLRFARRMLQWLPEYRPTAKELLEDPFMVGQFVI